MRVYSIFKSVSGEMGPFPQGAPVLFVRLYGCNLGCHYCDATETWAQNEIEAGVQDYTVPELVAEIKAERGIQGVIFTGGEPLLQEDDLMQVFDHLGSSMTIAVETNGTIVPMMKRDNIFYIVDIKRDSIVPAERTQTVIDAMVEHMPNNTYFKCVVGSVTDVDRAFTLAAQYASIIHGFAISPLSGTVSYKYVYDRILACNYPVILNCQVHKLMNLDEKER